MGFCKSVKNIHRIMMLLVVLTAMPLYGQYTDFRIIEELKGGEPQPRAILWNKKMRIALVHYKDQHIMVRDGFYIDKDWLVKEIKRESIVFGNNIEKRFIEIYLDPASRPRKFHHNWSFYGLPVSIWEAIELLAAGFNKNAVMHGFCSGAVTPKIHGSSIMEILGKVIPEGHRPRLDGDTLYVFPVVTPGESWSHILNRTIKFNDKALTIRFPDLAAKGNVKYIGEDIQYVLRVIALGSKTPITYPKDLHFPVYACYKDAAFAKILSDIVYTNQCIIAEREFGIEIIPWFGHSVHRIQCSTCCSNAQVSKPSKNTYTANYERYDKNMGAGPYPPPMMADPTFVPNVVRDRCISINKRAVGSHTVVVQPGYQNRTELNGSDGMNLRLPNLPYLPVYEGKR